MVHGILDEMLVKLAGLLILVVLYFRDTTNTLAIVKAPSLVAPQEKNAVENEAYDSSAVKVAEEEVDDFLAVDPFGADTLNLERSIEFSVCTSCGYRKNAEAQAQRILDRFPSLKLKITPHTPSFPRRMLSLALTGLTYVSLLYAFTGEKLLQALGMQEPMVISKLKENKLYVMAYFLLLNMASGRVSSSGAYEVSLDNLLLWSKIHSGSFPTDEQLSHAISEHLHI